MSETASQLRVPTYYVDLSKTVLKQRPFWMIGRCGGNGGDVREVEREEVAAAGVTDVEDDGIGICFNQKADAEIVAKAMARRLFCDCGAFGVDNEPITIFRPDGESFEMLRWSC